MSFDRKDKTSIVWCLWSLVLVLMTLQSTSAEESSKPKLLMTLPPLAMIAHDVADGQAEISLLNQNGSPHNRVLKPSDVRAMEDADLIVWVGDELEQFMVRFEQRYADKMLSMMESTSEAVHIHRDKHDHKEDAHGHHHGSVDPHQWLSPAASSEFATVIAEHLARLNPSKSDFYRQNAKRFTDEVLQAQQTWRSSVKQYLDAPYFVYHDAYQYLEQAVEVKSRAVLTVNPGIKPSAAQLGRLSRTLEGVDQACVFYEPEFQAIRLDRVTTAKLHYQMLDPLGSQLSFPDTQKQQYIHFIDGLVGQLTECLSQLK